MRKSRDIQGHMRNVLTVVVMFLLSLSPSMDTLAQDDGEEPSCPDGLVYYAEDDICLLPENVPVDDTLTEDGTEDLIDTSDDSDDLTDDSGEIDGENDESGEGIDDVTDESIDDLLEDNADSDELTDDSADSNEMTNPEPISDLTLQSYVCSEGINPMSGDADLETLCSADGTPAFTYTISVDGESIGSFTLQAGNGESGAVSLSSGDDLVPSGTLSIIATPLDGWTTGLVYCTITAVDGTVQQFQPPVGGESVAFPTAIGDSVSCDWYMMVGTSQTTIDTGNLQGVVGNPEAATGVQVDFTVRNCEAGTVATDILSAKCLTPGAGIAFTIANETTTLTMGTTDSDGGVRFANVPEGTWDFTQSLPTGFGEPLVFCQGTFDSALTAQEAQPDVFFGNQIRLFVHQSSTGFDSAFVDCTWFNVPAKGADNGPQIFIQTRWCQVDVRVPGNYSLSQAETLCPDAFADRIFSVRSNGQEIGTSSSANNGQLFFTKLPTTAGGAQFQIQPSLQGRERNAGIFCDKGPANGPFTIIELTYQSGNAIQTYLADGETMRCSWFIAALPPLDQVSVTPVPGPSSSYPVIQIYVRECPPTVDMSAPNDDLCKQDLTGVAFEVSWNGEYVGTNVNSGRTGILLYSPEYGEGTYVFNVVPIDGYGDGYFACTFAGGPNTGASSVGVVTTASPGITIDYEESTGVSCLIYYQIGNPVAGQSADDDVVEEVPNEAIAADEPANGADDAIPDDEAEEASDGTADEAFADDQAVQASTLTIQFWNCPEGTDPSSDQGGLLLTCATDETSREVTITSDDGVMTEGVTGLITLPFPGNTATATKPVGVRASSVWCSSSWVENGVNDGDFPDTVELIDGTLTISVGQAETTVYCDWFLFGGAEGDANSEVVLSADVMDEGRSRIQHGRSFYRRLVSHV